MEFLHCSRTFKRKVIVSTFIITGTLASIFVYQDIPAIGSAHAANIPTAQVQQTAKQSTITLPDFATIVAQQGSAVVNISVTGSVKTAGRNTPNFPQMDPNDPFYEFFRHFKVPTPQNKTPTHALGSGFIVSADGVVLTNAHVVANANEVTVKLTDKREFKAKVLGMDKVSDVAVLKIDATNLPTVNIGDPLHARVGEWVIAIGSPFGFENSVSAGIISAKSRSLPNEGYVPFLQTDVAINPGNSGGPLFNTSGQVIGINSQIFTRSGGYQGLSFAIPINVAMKVEQQILDHGKVSHGQLGIMIQAVTQRLAATFDLDKPTGALVSSVGKNTPAEKAGIQTGDVILKFNGHLITRSADLPPLVAEMAPGTPSKLEVWRKGKIRTLSVRVGNMEVAGQQINDEKQDVAVLGLSLRQLSPAERKQVQVNSGLLVENVADGPAAKAGIHSGDVILSVNSEPATSVKQLHSLLSKNKQHIALLILRGQQKMFIPVDIK